MASETRQVSVKTSEAMAHALRERAFLAVAKHEAEHTQFNLN
ncbi:MULTISPECIES: hypothetical protein [unclassified Campylobacter]|nr:MULTISPECIES: hypothetical protein [unclassified Campylobacter]MDA3079562.1 hypothetical protein [Campylobacter sp. CS_NA2]MDA3081006.1 hypothetical protein [Campylobacter sp. CS_NA1]MDA3085557.1 hypothetical protein [Campylobacter sp. CS_ED1]MDA3090395.1 hypothetical protein [Campylobacter sp. CS_ED2]WBR50823.1 hypothetical protein PF026_05590 [Campylobacter sp. CS_NA3]